MNVASSGVVDTVRRGVAFGRIGGQHVRFAIRADRMTVGLHLDVQR